MKLWSYLMVVLVVQSCVHTPSPLNRLVALVDPSVATEPGLSSEESKYYVPKIKFDTQVDSESVQQTMTLMSAVTEAGAKAIIIEWNTPGGEVDSGFLLSRAIEESPVPIICVVDGDAASMGMYILQSCHTRIMTKRSTLMIHEAAIGSGSFYGHEVTWRSVAERLKSTNIAMAEHLAHKMNVPATEILRRIEGGLQWWMNWSEALDVKAVDLVVNDVKEVTESYRNTLEAPNK